MVDEESNIGLAKADVCKESNDYGSIASVSVMPSWYWSPFTRLEPPGHKAFTAWIFRDNHLRHRKVGHDDDQPKMKGGLYWEEEEKNREVVRRFMGPKDYNLIQELDRHRRHHRSEDKKRGVKYETVSYKTEDSMLWHNKTLKVALGHEEHDSWWIRSWMLFSCAFARRMDPVRKWLTKTRLILRTMLVVLGISMSLVGFAVSHSSEKLLEWKLEYITGNFYHRTGLGFAIFLLFNWLFVFFAFIPAAYRPVAAGSGIAEAKAVLNGILVPQCTELATALCKAVSVVFAGAASLPVGLEGPMIFVGLSLGENCQRLIPHTDFPTLQWDRMRRDLAAVGTACGVSAAFYAPIGGVLFAFEEGASFWSTHLTFMAFAADCVTAVFSFLWNLLRKSNPMTGFDVEHMAKFAGVAGHGAATSPTFTVWDYFVFALMGIVGGVVGALWCEVNSSLAIFRSKLDLSLPLKLVELLVLTTVMSALLWWLPQAYMVCGNLDEVLAEHEYFREFGCPVGQYNHLATLLLNPPGSTALNLVYWEPITSFTAVSCVIAGSLYLIMLLLFFGTSTGMGVFIPLLFIGACFGRAVGVWWNLEVNTYAIVGSVGMLAGVARVLISLTVIMVETTGLSYFVTPLMVVTLFARVFGKAVFGRDGIYDILLQLKGIPFLEEELPDQAVAGGLKAIDIMCPTLVSLPPLARVSDLLAELKLEASAAHQDFAVVDNRTCDGGKVNLVGVISRKKLLILLQHKQLFFDDKASSPPPLEYEYFLNSHEKAPKIETIESTFTEADLKLSLDLTPYVELAHNTFDRNGSAERAYEMFRTMGLRYLVITGKHGEPVGCITRSDLVLLEELGVNESTLTSIRESVAQYSNIN